MTRQREGSFHDSIQMDLDNYGYYTFVGVEYYDILDCHTSQNNVDEKGRYWVEDSFVVDEVAGDDFGVPAN